MSQEAKSEKYRNFADRLRSIRERRGLSQADLAALLGINASSVGNWESKRNGPSTKRMAEIAKTLNVSVDYLTGREASQAPAATDVSEPKPLTEVLPHGVPVVSWARAGDGGNFGDLANQIDEWIYTDCQDANGYALIVEGDSMMPRIEPGDRAIFMPNVEARNGDVVVARLQTTGDVYLKVFHTTGRGGEIVRLTSFNPVYPPLEFHLKEFRFIHPLHSLLKRWRR